MTGAEHYAEAERIVRVAREKEQQLPHLTPGDRTAFYAARQDSINLAQVHATLALAAAHGANRCPDVDSFEQRCHLEAGHDGHHSIPVPAAEKAWVG
jgi:hypothetical protein